MLAKLTVFFPSAEDVLISESITDFFDFYPSLLEVVLPLQKMMASTSNTFKNSFVGKSAPVHLLTLASMLIYDPRVTNKTF